MKPGTPIDKSSISKTSFSSRTSRRSGKSLAEKMRELGLNLHHQRPQTTWATLQYMDIKLENNRPSKISIMTPILNLEQITYYQPEIAEGISSGKNVYKIFHFETKSKGPKEIRKITDIEVKSYKPAKTLKFRKKKRHSSIIQKIDEIMNRGKEPAVSRDPSEESIVLNHKLQEGPQKTINDLPENVLLAIFSYFSQKERCLTLSKVCKSWYFALKDPVFWTELEFREDRVDPASIISLIKKYPSLRKLRLTSVPKVVEILVELCRCNHSITHLGVRRCDVTGPDFARIILHVISCCTELEELDIKGMRFQSERFYLELGRLVRLKSLNLNGNKLVRNHDLITLSVNCRSLTDLRLLDTTTDQDAKFALRDEDLSFIAAHLQHNLETLKLDMQQLGSISYQAIIKCSGLKCLALKNCLLLTGEMFRHFPLLTNLRKLKITRAINLKSEDFQVVFEDENMQTIQELDINGCWGVGEAGLEAITGGLRYLRSLSLKNCKSIKGAHLDLLSQCPELTCLNIAHADVDARDLSSLHLYAKNLTRLTLDVRKCRKSVIRHLKKFFPSIDLIFSFSEFQKDERPLTSIVVTR